MSGHIKINILLLIIALATVVVFLRNQINDRATYEAIQIALQDSLSISRNKLGEEIANRKVIETERSKDFINLQVKDGTIVKLQNIVKNYKGKLKAASILNTQTESSAGNATNAEEIKNIIIRNDSVFVYPEYQTNWENKWEKGKIRANKDSIFHNIRINNEYEITLGKQKNGWFKKPSSTVTILNKNPNTETKELRTFQVVPIQKKIGLGFFGGLGNSFDTNGFRPMIGIGVTYTLIPIK